MTFSLVDLEGLQKTHVLASMLCCTHEVGSSDTLFELLFGGLNHELGLLYSPCFFHTTGWRASERHRTPLTLITPVVIGGFSSSEQFPTSYATAS